MGEEKLVLTMDCVRISKEKLTGKIKENRQLHETAYNEAVEAYKVIVVNKMKEKMEETIKQHEKYMKQLQENLDSFEKDWQTKPLVSVEKPSNHLDDYDTAISMLEFSLDDVVELDRKEFQSYVMDKWSWKADFDVTRNAMISGSLAYGNKI